jgi:hypothetical protein
VKTKADEKAVMYLHCRRCIEQLLHPSVEAFVDRDGKVWVWCRNHDINIYHTNVQVLDVATMQCAHCAGGVPYAH